MSIGLGTSALALKSRALRPVVRAHYNVSSAHLGSNDGKKDRSDGICKMTQREFYRAYIDCLNRQDWDELGRYVADDVKHNGRALGLSGYRSMLIKNFEDIPDLRFVVVRLACDPPLIAARLMFDCSPKRRFLGLEINGQRISFAENVFYEVQGGKIIDVFSVIDKTSIENQIA